MAIASPRWAGDRSRSGTLPQDRKSSSSARARTRCGQSPGAPTASDWRQAADRTARIWDAATGKEIFAFHGFNGAVLSVAWSPDGRHLAAGDVDTVKVWDATKGQEIVDLKGKASPRSPGARTANVWPRGNRWRS